MNTPTLVLPPVYTERKNYRWHATVYYRTDSGTVEVEHDLQELYELHDLVEHGPHWDTIERIVVIRVCHVDAEDLTVEQAKEL
jgi:hypothetical protein